MSDYLFMCVCVCACVCVPVCTLSLAFPARGAHINTRGTNCGDICNWFHLNFENIFARIELRFLFDDYIHLSDLSALNLYLAIFNPSEAAIKMA